MKYSVTVKSNENSLAILTWKALKKNFNERVRYRKDIICCQKMEIDYIVISDMCIKHLRQE